MRILVVNVGSSSLKLSVLDGEGTAAAADLPMDGAGAPVDGAGVDRRRLRAFVDRHGPVEAVGHRVVHGGADFTAPVVVDEDVRRRMQELVDLAPLHLPRSLAGLDLVGSLLPDVPAVACFDTAFHATIPAAAATYALPAEWRRRWPLRRFGFHGLSHAWASSRAAALLGQPVTALRTVTCHLGAGASAAAVHGGVSVDTTMGFTPLEGLVMATRSGSVDPGLVLWLEQHVGLPPDELAATLEQRSGLAGLAGTKDMRRVLQAEGEGDPDAALAVGVVLHRLRAAVASMAAAMDGLDALVFTGGVGEHAHDLRRRAADGLGFLGIAVDAAANAGARPDADVTGAGATVRTLVVEAREDLQIAGEVTALLGADGP